MDFLYSTNKILNGHLLDGEKGGFKYIKKRTFDQAVEEGALTYNVVGRTTLKQPTQEDKKILVVSQDEKYALTQCQLTRIVGYIPLDNGTFVEYRQFNFVIPIVFGLGVVAIGSIAFGLANKQVIEEPAPTGGAIGYDPSQTNKPDDPKAPTKEAISFPSITMPGYAELRMAANTTKIDTISLYNPAQNEGWYDLTFKLMVDTDRNGDFETTLYESAKVAPGYRVSDFEIAQPLEAGKYSAKILINPYYVNDDSVVLNNGSIDVDLIVEEVKNPV